MRTKARNRTEEIVYDRYTAAAKAKEGALCCPVDYDPEFLKIIPREVIDRDYGCGDPSKYIQPGDTVLDLGSGTGKICFIAAQKVGAAGKVIGVDFNDEMLEIARRHHPLIAERLEYDNIRFLRGRIQDLSDSPDELDAYLAANPVHSGRDLDQYEVFRKELADRAPLIRKDSVDIIVSNCVLNLVSQPEKQQLFSEMFRVLKRGGRVAISDIVSDEDVPAPFQKDPELWSGCIAGAFREDRFLEAFEQAGFHAIQITKYEQTPWQTVKGVEFRSVTITACKGKQGPCRERNQAVLYKGPWKKVEDDDGHVLIRGKRMAVCDKTYHIMTGEPYADQVLSIPPIKEIPLDQTRLFACQEMAIRDPRETKGKRYRKTVSVADSSCGPDECC
jgi:arsenite methyltransferase